MTGRIIAIIKKEHYHILRDPRTLLVVFIMPVMMVILYGYALNMDVEHIRLGVIDRDRSQASADLVEAFGATAYFDIVAVPGSSGDADPLFRDGTIRALLVVPRGYAESIRSGAVTEVQLLVDGSDTTVGNAVINYSNAICAAQSMKTGTGAAATPVEVRGLFHFNSELKSTHFITPGIVAVVLMMVCALLTSVTVAREKETGTMDILLVSPVRPFEILVGKVVPYIVLAVIDAVFILVFSKFIFDIPLHGSMVLLFGLSILYIYCAMGIGLFISSMAPTQQVAMMAALVATILPSMILSGFIFSIFSMPKVIQLATHIVPARYYITIIRGILLKSAGFGELHVQTAALAVLGTFFIVAAALRFTTRVK